MFASVSDLDVIKKFNDTHLNEGSTSRQHCDREQSKHSRLWARTAQVLLAVMKSVIRNRNLGRGNFDD